MSNESINERMMCTEKDIERILDKLEELSKKIDDRDAELKTINRLAFSVERLADELTKVVDKVDEHEKKLIALDRQSDKSKAEIFNKVFDKILMAAVGGILALIWSAVK